MTSASCVSVNASMLDRGCVAARGQGKWPLRGRPLAPRAPRGRGLGSVDAPVRISNRCRSTLRRVNRPVKVVRGCFRLDIPASVVCRTDLGPCFCRVLEASVGGTHFRARFCGSQHTNARLRYAFTGLVHGHRLDRAVNGSCQGQRPPPVRSLRAGSYLATGRPGKSHRQAPLRAASGVNGLTAEKHRDSNGVLRMHPPSSRPAQCESFG
jgi:hypothetical protein